MLLVVDANVLVGELSRRHGRGLMRDPHFDLKVSEGTLDEAHHEPARRVDVIVSHDRMRRETAGAVPK